MAGASLKPEFYHEKIKLACFLAPAAAMKHTKVWPHYILGLDYLQIQRWFIELSGFFNIYPSEFTLVSYYLCKYATPICAQDVAKYEDTDMSVDDPDRMLLYYYNYPSGASWYQYEHFGQLMMEDEEKFQRYDYDSEAENIKHYGQPTPPDYDLSKLDFPIAIFSGSLDNVTPPEDIKWLSKKLEKQTIYNKEYRLGHISFLFGKDMSYFTNDLMNIMNKYNGKPYRVTPNWLEYLEEKYN